MADKTKQDDKSPVTIKHHAGFVSGLELLFWRYREQVDIEPEKWLSTEGIRMDVLILKKDPFMELDFDIGRIFKGHNILEYKRPDDKLNIDVFAKVMAYANLYKAQGIPVNAISYSDISATIFRHAYPRDAFRQLREHGAVIEEKFPGVYYVTGMSPFPVQVLVGRRLDPKEYAMFRVIRSGASDDDIRNFQEMAAQNKDAAYQKSVDNILQVSANKESYARLVKEDPEMCEALRDLMKADLEKSEERGAIKEAIKLYHDELKLMPTEIIKKIMVRFSLEKSVAEQYVKETLGLVMA